MLVGGATAGHMVSALQTGSGASAWETVARISGGLRVSGNVPAAVSNVQHGISPARHGAGGCLSDVGRRPADS